jgi:hypothetical protein
MTTKAAERAVDLERAKAILDSMATHFHYNGLLLVSANYGTGTTDYFRVSAVDTLRTNQMLSNLTWAMSKVFGYSLRDRNGRMYLALNGGNYSKPDELARTLADYYGLDRVRYEIV